jgi:hypothetical protein
VSSVQAGGYITNNTGVQVYITDGSIENVVTSPNGGCAPYVTPQTVTVTDNNWVPPNGGNGGAWTATLGLHASTPDACQGQYVDFKVRINAST